MAVVVAVVLAILAMMDQLENDTFLWLSSRELFQEVKLRSR